MNIVGSNLIAVWRSTSLILQISIGLILGTLLAILSPDTATSFSLLGDLFVGGLKAVAPLLVFVLVMSAIANHEQGQKTAIKPLLSLYFLGTVIAAFVALIASKLFPTTLALDLPSVSGQTPGGISEVLQTLLFNIVTNPVEALINGNFIGILAWAVLLGLALQQANKTTKTLIHDMSNAVTRVVKVVIGFAPLGIFGLVANTIAVTGFAELANYLQLLVVLVGCMLVMALVINPLVVYLRIKKNPYPLVFTCLRESGVTAFFTRSSAANIPVNLALCEKLGLPEDTYSVSIPLGATINMAGAAITITTLTLAAVNTIGIEVDIWTSMLLCVVAAISACGASGVAGGSLLLIPLACSLFGIDNSVAMQVVAIGFVISVIQDACETALNSSTDVVYTAAACAKP